MAPSPEVITPAVIEWELVARPKRRKGEQPGEPEKRTFYQMELTIDGEVSLLSLASRTLATLAESGFPISKLQNLQKPDGDLDTVLAAQLMTEAAPFIPNVASESTAILFGYYPINEEGRRDPDYDETVAFLRRAVSIPQWVDFMQVFLNQNDWERMMTPFGAALRKGLTLGLWAEKARADAIGSGSTT